MTDILIPKIPIPMPRPLMEETIHGGGPSVLDRMPLERPTEAADAFNIPMGYPTTSEDTNRISELLIGSDWWKLKFNQLGEYMNFSSYSGYGDKALESTSYEQWLIVSAVFAASVMFYYGMKFLHAKMGWKW